MFQSQPPQRQNNMYLVYWALAVEPVILALVALFLKERNAVNISLAPGSEEPMLVVLLALTAVFIWLSFKFTAVRKLLSRGVPFNDNIEGFRLAALSLAIIPGMFGFIHYLFFGKIISLLLFNGVALGMAVKHISKFNEGNS